MKSALSTQNRQTFFLRTKFRLPRFAGPPGRPPGPPPGPEDRGPPPPPDDPYDCCCDAFSSAIRFLPDWNPDYVIRLCRRRCGLRFRPRHWWRSRNGLARTARCAALAVPLQLVLPLQFFVQTHGEIFHHRVGHLQPALKFFHHFTVARANHHVNVITFPQLLHAVGHVLAAPFIHRVDCAALFGGYVLQCRYHFVDVRFRRIRTADKNQIVKALFHMSSISSYLYNCCNSVLPSFTVNLLPIPRDPRGD